jgi:hypothetical protein
MAFISHRWPFIHPGTLDQIDIAWWAYYVRAAQAVIDAQAKTVKAGARGR